MKALFVTGTDTGCGKTEVSLGLMAAWQARGLRVLGMKPVATGGSDDPAGLRNDDALRLLAQGGAEVPYGLINPNVFAPAIAPHIAAGEAGNEIELAPIASAFRALCAETDRLVVEGVGGWRVPLSASLSVSDIPKALGLPVLLVVGMRLGCLNHAQLTWESIRAQGCHLAGWVANGIDPQMQAGDANLATLAALMGAPCIGVIPWQPDRTPESTAALLDPDAIDWPVQSPRGPGRPAKSTRVGTQR
jgi:dethiobiotin synthetase